MKPIPWDDEEAALLVAAYWTIDESPALRNKILKELSEILCSRAKRKGLLAVAQFRNLNGINFQYSLLQYRFTHGKRGIHGQLLKTIAEVSDLYTNNYEKYIDILKRASKGAGLMEQGRKPGMGSFSYLKQKVLAFFCDASESIITTEKIGGGRQLTSLDTNSTNSNDPSSGSENPAEGLLAWEKEETTPEHGDVSEKEIPPAAPSYPVEERPWDRYEAALLAEACLRIEEEPSRRDSILEELLEVLKKRTIQRGIQMDVHFLEVSAILPYYQWMTYLLKGTSNRLNGAAPKTFAEVANIYKKDKSWFFLLVHHGEREAGVLVENKEEKKTPITVVNGVRVQGEEADRTIGAKKWVHVPPPEKKVTAPAPVKVASSHTADRKEDFTEQEIKSTAPIAPSTVYGTEQTKKVESQPIEEKKEPYGMKREVHPFVISLKYTRDYTGLIPRGFYCGSSHRLASSWEELYRRCLQYLLPKHTGVFKVLRAQSVYQSGRPYIVATMYKGRLKKACYLDEGFYAELDLTPNQMMNYLRQVILKCQIPWEDFLLEFVEEGGEPAPIEPVVDAIESPPTLPLSPRDGKEEGEKPSVASRNSEEEKAPSPQEGMTYDLSEKREYTSLCPCSWSYFEEEKSVNSWEEFYISCCRTLLEDYPVPFAALRWKCLKPNHPFYLAGRFDTDRLRNAQQIGEGFYLEMDITPDEMVDFIHQALIECQVDFENLTVTFQTVNQESSGPEINPAEPIDRPIEPIDLGGNPENLPGENQNTSPGESPTEEVSKKEKINKVLLAHFPDGLRLNNLSIKRFKAAYEEMLHETLDMDTKSLLEEVKSAGNLRSDGRVYGKQDTQDQDVFTTMVDEIRTIFADGGSAISWSCLFEKYRESLAKVSVFNAEVMQGELVKKLQMTDLKVSLRKPGVITMPDTAHLYGQEIIGCIKEATSPMTPEDIQQIYWYWPVEEIKKMLKGLDGIVVTGGAYFYMPNVPISEDERKKLHQSVMEEIEDIGFMTTPRIEELLAGKCPGFAQDVKFLTPTALRKMVGYLFREDIQVNGAVLVKQGSSLGLNDILHAYCQRHSHLTSMEIKEFTLQIGKKGNFCSEVMKDMVRVSSEQWVRRDQVSFSQPSAIAKELDACMGDRVVMPICEVQLFLGFPPISVPWNQYVLESFLFAAEYIPFELVQNNGGISESGVYGAIVRRGHGIDSYHAALVTWLAQDSTWHTKEEAMDLIVTKELQVLRRVNGIDEILREAKALRKKWEKEKE